MIYFTDPEKRVYYAFFNDNFDKDLLKQYFEYYKSFFPEIVCYQDDTLISLDETPETPEESPKKKK